MTEERQLISGSVEQAEEKTYRQAARGRIVTFPFALGLIVLGVLLLVAPEIEGFDVTLPVGVMVMVAAFVLTNLFRFFSSGRRERGLYFLALVLISFGVVLAVIVNIPDADASEWWPLVLVGISLSYFFTFIFERQHENGLVGVGLLVMIAAVVALMVTVGVIPQEVLDTAGDYWPLLIAFVGVTLIPLAFRQG
ncbi:MAG: hypothetical protein K8I82_19495 [Anaerolineae bacterium]|nr:hypothetical protein [Anaerolineae bacterium]